MAHPLALPSLGLSVDPAVYVLDSSAVLALLLRELGGDMVAQAVPRSVITAASLAECLTALLRRGAGEPEASLRLRRLALPVIAWTEELAWDGADLCCLAWTHGLSLGDRACLATARALDRIALTADAAWIRAVRTLRRPVRVQLIR